MEALSHITEQLDQMIKLLAHPQQDLKICWLTVEEYAQVLNEPNSIKYLKRLLNPNLPARTQPVYINPDDVVRVAGVSKIRYCPIPVKGVSYPRYVDKTN